MFQPSKPVSGSPVQGDNEKSPVQDSNENVAVEVDSSYAAADGSSESPACGEVDEALEGEAVEVEVLPEPEEGELAAAQNQAKEWQDKYMRLHAEWDTYRRRTTEQRAIEKARAAEKLVESLIPVLDDFDRTIDYAEKNGEQGLLEGVRAVGVKFGDVLVKGGVQVIDPAGEAFNALEAQAVATVEDTSVPDETVAQVYQKGYKMGDKVLRPAMVTVSAGGPKREKPQEDTDTE